MFREVGRVGRPRTEIQRGNSLVHRVFAAVVEKVAELLVAGRWRKHMSPSAAEPAHTPATAQAADPDHDDGYDHRGYTPAHNSALPGTQPAQSVVLADLTAELASAAVDPYLASRQDTTQIHGSNSEAYLPVVEEVAMAAEVEIPRVYVARNTPFPSARVECWGNSAAPVDQVVELADGRGIVSCLVGWEVGNG